jgi:hypothetical protein
MTTKKYYSYKTFYPEEISGSYVTVFNEYFTGLENRSDAELEGLGFVPVELPEGLYKIKNQEGKYPPEEYWTHSYRWDRTIPGFIVEEKSLEQKISQIDYNRFWNELSETSAYDKIREESMTSLSVNTVATELIALFSDAKSNNNIKVNRIQSCLDFIFANIEFTEVELQEIQEIFVGTGMHYQYTIPNAN